VCDKIVPSILPCLNEAQHGFVKGMSTVTNLACYSDYLLTNLKDCVQIDAIYTDFAKAFDRVPHKVLIGKLRQLGFSGSLLNWISCYLDGRIQNVKIGNSISHAIEVTSGVPQGSHLGPILFALFINDLCGIFKFAKILLYADDGKIYLPINSVFDVIHLQSDLNRLVDWCYCNQMELNVSKCEMITFSRKPEHRRIDSAYFINDEPLRKVSVVRDLGVLFDKRVTFKEQVDSVVSKASMTLGFVKRQAKEFNSPLVTKSLYCALVRSIIEYASVVWMPHTATDIRRIESVQKQFLLFALRHLYLNHGFQLPPYVDRLQIIDLRSLEVRRSVSCCMFVYDVLVERLRVASLSSSLVVRESGRTLRSSSQTQLVVPFAASNYEANAVIGRCCRKFNLVFDLFDRNYSREWFRDRATERLLSLSN
jgi:hypothetical protein